LLIRLEAEEFFAVFSVSVAILTQLHNKKIDNIKNDLVNFIKKIISELQQNNGKVKPCPIVCYKWFFILF
jgi:hypothetical protein